MQRLITPLLQLAIVVIGGLQVAMAGGFDTRSVWVFIVLVVGAIVTYVSPLLVGRWPSLLKIAASVVFGIAAAVIEILDGGGVFDQAALLVIALAALNALSVAIGTDARVRNAAKHLADPNDSNAAAIAADPTAAKIAARLPVPSA